MSPDLCECGCGNLAKPGNRYLHGHYSRSLRRHGPIEYRTARCPRCQSIVRLRADGTFGVHWMSQRKSDYRRRCPEGGQRAPLRRPRPGRRVTVSIDAVLPEGWDLPRFKAEASQVLRTHLDEPFVVSLDAEEAS